MSSKRKYVLIKCFVIGNNCYRITPSNIDSSKRIKNTTEHLSGHDRSTNGCDVINGVDGNYLEFDLFLTEE